MSDGWRLKLPWRLRLPGTGHRGQELGLPRPPERGQRRRSAEREAEETGDGGLLAGREGQSRLGFRCALKEIQLL